MKKFIGLLSLLALGVSFGHATGVDGSTFVSQIVPTNVVAGSTFTVTQTWTNSGTSTWTSGALYRIGAQNPQDNGTWGTGRYLTFGSVAPGVSAAYNFTLTAPTTPGTYNFQSEIVHDGVAWFGPTSGNVSITVTSATGPALKVLDPTP